VDDFGLIGLAYIAGFGAIVALAGLYLARTLEPAYPITVGLCLSVFSGNWGKMGVPLPLDRLFLVVGIVAALAVVWRERRDRPFEFRPVHVAMYAVAAWGVGSALWAATLSDGESRFALIDKLGIVPFVLFALAPVVYRTEKQRNILLTALVVLGGYLSVTAVFEALKLDALVHPTFISDPNNLIHLGRARGPFLEASANGLALYAALVACAIAVALWRHPGARWAAGFVGLLCIVGIVCTLTRQAWLGAAVATFATALIAPQLRRYVIPGVAAACAIVAFSLTAIPGLQSNASERADSDRPVWDRLNSNQAALNMIDERPLAGFGWGTFGEESRDYYEFNDDRPVTNVDIVHNVILSHAVELGLIGVILWVTTLLMVLVPVFRGRAPPELEPWRLGVIAYSIFWFVVSNFTPLGYPFPNYLLWLLPGIVYASLLPRESRQPAPAIVQPARP
jgi:O-antigen ligase